MLAETVSSCLPGFGKAVPDARWREVYLIGGGPSLRGFDLRCLQGKAVVAVNDAVLHTPWAMALFSLDANWISNRKSVIEQFSGETYLGVPEDYEVEQRPEHATLLLRKRSREGFSEDPSQIHMGGGNSGFGAFNLAFLKGAKRIILLGYDLCHSSQHWHDGYSWNRNGKDAMYRNWAYQFNFTTKQLFQRGVEVLNASHDSLVTAFPKIALSKIPLSEE